MFYTYGILCCNGDKDPVISGRVNFSGLHENVHLTGWYSLTRRNVATSLKTTT